MGSRFFVLKTRWIRMRERDCGMGHRHDRESAGIVEDQFEHDGKATSHPRIAALQAAMPQA
jgi:hypothetical protein